MTPPPPPPPPSPDAFPKHAAQPLDPNVTRLLDANANRAREALRVMEDAARFLLNDTPITETAKNLRHDFATALRKLPDLPLNRDTPNDVGTALTTEAEQQRGSVVDVAIAAGKRLSESLRCCEEYGKLIDGSFAADVKQIRYRGYELERLLHQRLTTRPAKQWRLCAIITADMCEHHDWLDVARAAADNGVDCIQLREKSLAGGELLDRVERIRAAVEGRADVIVNDRPDVAMLASAAGVHLGQDDLPIARVKRMLGPAMLIGASTHDLDEASRAVEGGADYCGVGAIYPTTTKQRTASGLAYLRAFVQQFPDMPHLAIGGINADNIAEVVEAGARGVAVSGVICRAADPAAVTRRLLQAFDRDGRRAQPDGLTVGP
ncbi:MAG: thiamine phosphate synthase [Phycisphaeraceae bacterium]